jgi:(1->4)-alpha-D-glucan 1-alpha-D-glucosylmutase
VNWELRRRLLGSPDAPAKLDAIRSALALRARRPAAFAGSYEPLDAGPDVCAFTRGAEVLVAVAVRGGLASANEPPGEWRDVYRTPHSRLAERVS